MDQQAGERVPAGELGRRGFLKWAIGVLSGLAAVVIGWPLLASLFGGVRRRLREDFVKVVDLAELPAGQPVKLTFPYFSEDAYMHEEKTHDLWVVKRSDTDVTVFSPICPHLACRYTWFAQARQFVCPCHGSVFAADGKVLAGPSPRPLDVLPHKIEGGGLFVRWQRYQPAIAEKVTV